MSTEIISKRNRKGNEEKKNTHKFTQKNKNDIGIENRICDTRINKKKII